MLKNRVNLNRFQKNVVRERSNFNVVSHGRRWGATTLCKDRVIYGRGGLLEGNKVAWCTPKSEMFEEAFYLIFNEIRHIVKTVEDNSHAKKRIVTLNGGIIDFYVFSCSLFPLNNRYDKVIVESAAQVKNLQVNSIRIEESLRCGEAWFVSTPSGKDNYFYDLFNRDCSTLYWQSFMCKSIENIRIGCIKNYEVETLKSIGFDESFLMQEYECEFVTVTKFQA